MGVSTKCIVNRVKSNKVIEVLKKAFGDEIVEISNLVKEESDGESGYIEITFKSDKKTGPKKDRVVHRSLYFIENNTEKYKDVPDGNYSRMCLGATGNSVEIMKKIYEGFKNGYIDKNDCDSIDYEKFNKIK